MVKIRQSHSADNESFDIDAWIQHIESMVALKDQALFREACNLSRQVEKEASDQERIWAVGYSSFLTGIEMSEILADLHLDQDTLIAAVLYRAVREKKLALEIVKGKFGETVAKLIQGVLQMAAISMLQDLSKKKILGQINDQVDTLRKMLVALIDDVRVALIKLAERTCAIRAVKKAPPEKQLRVAREVFYIYAPLAHRLGIGHIKWELEDLAFRYLDPDVYLRIAKLLDGKRLDREKFIKDVQAALEKALKLAGIDAVVMGRVKHIYSIWRKMRQKNLDFHEIYDIRAVRILVNEVKDCYAALGVVHALWRHIPKEFDDYVAQPKINGYQSLHTAVVGPQGKILEVQIRTHQMHEEAELGVCSHWRYKGTDTQEKMSSYEAKIAWLRQILEWQDELGDLSGLVEQFRHDIIEDRIYVFTPEGHVIDLPTHSTPIDFAYRVHTEIGHRCRGAKVNNHIASLNSMLKTGDHVEIITTKQGGPSRDWLNSDLGFIKTARARAKIQQWFKQQSREQNLSEGRAVLLDELQRLGIRGINLETLASKLNFSSVDDLYVSLGSGDMRLSQVANAAQEILGPPQEQQLDLVSKSIVPRKALEKAPEFSVRGVGNLLSSLASCCKPVPGDPIIGFITQGRGVSVHLQTCPNVDHLRETTPERLVDVAWGASAQSVFPVDIAIKAFDREGLLRDIAAVLANEHVNLIGANTRSNKHDNTASMLLTVEVGNLASLGRLLNRIQQLPNIVDVKRIISNR